MMASDNDAAIDFMVNLKLTEDDWNKPLTDIHISDICRKACGKWKLLSPYLGGMEEIDISDIENTFAEEEVRRSKFLKRWREKMGSEANFKRLISALLRIKCRRDAEIVCGLLQLQISRNVSPSATTPPISPGELGS